MSNVSLRDLLEAGVHFGHRTHLWNPKMKPYIYGQKNGVHIIDLQKTARALVESCRYVTTSVARGDSVLFVGTKRAAREVIEEQAIRASMFFVNNRWLGGTLTNFNTVRKSIERLTSLEAMRDEGKFEQITKKEALEITRQIAKMQKSLAGIKAMKTLPGVLYVIDPKREHIAVREANKLGIPVVALCDTNCDPDGVTHLIPGNDDALKSIRLFTTALAEAAVEGGVAGRGALGDAIVAPVDMGDVEVYRRSTGESSPDQPEGEAAAEGDPAAGGEPAEEGAPEDVEDEFEEEEEEN